VNGERDALGRLERHLGRLLVTGVIVSAVLLAAGLALWLTVPGAPLSRGLLNGGLVVLMATPILRVFVSFVEYVRMKDWVFVATTIVVLIELTVTVVVALTRG
jgi:uncharacterized membrane protein